MKALSAAAAAALIILAAGGPVLAKAPAGQAAVAGPAAGPGDGGVEALVADGVDRASRKDFQGALASFDAALARDPQNSFARLGRALVRSYLDDAAGALADFDAVLANAPTNRAALLIKGQLLMRTGHPRAAIDVLQRLVDQDPEDADALVELAHARQASEDPGEAVTALMEYERALRLDPERMDVYGLRGEILSAHGDAAGVDKNYQAWLARAPQDAEAHAAYANALLRVGQSDRARAEVERSLALGPNAEAYMVRAQLRPPSEAAEAIADADKAVAEGGSGSAYLIRGALHARLDHDQLALADLDRSLQAWPASIAALRIRQQLHQRHKRYDLALKDADRLIELLPDSAEDLNNRCYLRAQAGIGLDQALADCERALARVQDPAARAHMLDSRALVRFRQGQFAAAAADYDAALALQPTLAGSRYQRGLARLRLGQTAAGEADLRAAEAAAPGVAASMADLGLTP